MSILVMILGAIGLLIVLLLIAALFVKKRYTITRSVSIDKPQQDVYEVMRLLHNQSRWSVWVMADPNIRRDYTGTDGTVGATVHWTSDDKAVGEGIQTITKLASPSFIQHQIQFIKPFSGLATITFTVSPIDNNRSTLSFSMDSGMKYPMNIMLVLMNLEAKLGTDMQRSLDNVKSMAEQG